jgi:hypothetical protein
MQVNMVDMLPSLNPLIRIVVSRMDSLDSLDSLVNHTDSLDSSMGSLDSLVNHTDSLDSSMGSLDSRVTSSLMVSRVTSNPMGNSRIHMVHREQADRQWAWIRTSPLV